MENSLDVELFLMGWQAARDGLSLSEGWPNQMVDGWRLWHGENRVVELARHRRRACNETFVPEGEKMSCSILPFFRA